MTSRGKKAVAYVCAMTFPGTDIVISKDDQKQRIRRFAEREGIEIIAWYEDDAQGQDFMALPGVQQVLNHGGHYDLLLVERVWVFSRNKSALFSFAEAVEKRGAEIAAAACLWDCLSQQIRHRYMGVAAERKRQGTCELGSPSRRRAA
jgi:DNA invertase Pin-like site-specific DNA recombinase